jgi:hypothetical protein
VSFQEEVQEIIADISVEMAGCMEHKSPETVQVIQDFLSQIFVTCKDKPEEFLASLRTLVFMMFLAGREHAQRRYKPPIPASGSFESVTHTEFEAWLKTL